ncbi:hypothetical protein ACFLXE_07100 [Chloroflexota bacterium]
MATSDDVGGGTQAGCGEVRGPVTVRRSRGLSPHPTRIQAVVEGSIFGGFNITGVLYSISNVGGGPA